LQERLPYDEFVSNLPPFTAKRSKDFPAFLVVYCGRDDCPGTMADRPFLVSEREWMRPLHRVSRLRGVEKQFVITGRSCPYCFRAGRLPKRREIS
jgi:hypothetical protein